MMKNLIGGLFGRSQPASGGLETLPFKSTQDAFAYACAYMDCTVAERQLLCAIVVDQIEKPDPLGALIANWNQKEAENKFVPVRVLVSADDGGFESIGLCFDKSSPPQAGDLVYWVPQHHHPMMGQVMGDDRCGWIGRLVAELEPVVSVRSGFQVRRELP